MTDRTSSARHRRPGFEPAADVDDPNYYELLGVPYTATTADIQRAYRAAMKRTHPDRQAAERRAEAEAQARLLNRAYSTLCKPGGRQQYDQTLRTQEVQDQIMRRYVSGSMPPQRRQVATHLRHTPSPAERREQAQANRSALLSLLAAFAVLTGVVLGLVLVYAAVQSLLGAVF